MRLSRHPRGVVGADVSTNAWTNGSGGGGGGRMPLGTIRFEGGDAVNLGGNAGGVGPRGRNFEPLDEDSENSLGLDARGGGGGGSAEFLTPLKSRR